MQTWIEILAPLWTAILAWRAMTKLSMRRGQGKAFASAAGYAVGFLAFMLMWRVSVAIDQAPRSERPAAMAAMVEPLALPPYQATKPDPTGHLPPVSRIQ
jgi:hypothetical protein